MPDADTWLVEHLTAVLDAASDATNEGDAVGRSLRELQMALEPDVTALVGDDTVVAATGPASSVVDRVELLRATTGGPGAELAGLGSCDIAIGPLRHDSGRRIVVARAQRPFSRQERSLVVLVGRSLGLALDMLSMLDTERTLRDESERQARERDAMLAGLTKRHQLLDNLGQIERSISQRTPLGEVLSTICEAVHQMLGDEVVGLRLLDPDDPAHLIVVADSGVSPEIFDRIRRTPVGEGAGGRAVAENRLVVLQDYADNPTGLAAFAEGGVRAAMAAPVHEGGRPVGSLAVASFRPDRVYTALEQETLLAFAEHVSLALGDARSLEEMREAQRAKDTLLAMVSHELKTPLTVIMGVVQTIQRHAERLPDALRDEMLTSAKERGHELERLIDRLLQGARGEPSGIAQEAYLPALLSAAIRPYEATRRILLRPVPPELVEVDAVSAQNALGNLLENAINHSVPGTEVLVDTTLAGDQVSVAVTNSGALPNGVAVETLFVPFLRGDDARSPGVGLGLFIAARLADSIGGAISVSTTADEVTFTLSFPVHGAAVPEPPAKAVRRGAARRSRTPGPRRR
jgi:signal transduction histidine kinase